LAACGSGMADGIAVQVGGTHITRAATFHWMSVIAGEVSTLPGQPTPLVPQPPGYSACITYRRRYATAPRVAGQPLPTPIELKRECELEFQKEKLKALYFLISYAWVDGEASELGVKVTSQSLQRELARLQTGISSPVQLRRFLVGARGTAADLMLRLKLNLLTTEIRRKLEHEKGGQQLTVAQRQQVLNRFSAQFARRWMAKTNCHPGYVVPICAKHTGPEVAPTLMPPSVPLTKMTAE